MVYVINLASVTRCFTDDIIWGKWSVPHEVAQPLSNSIFHANKM